MDSSASEVTEDDEPGLVDVTRVPLAELLLSHDPALTDSLRRLLADLDQSRERFAAFNNYV
jgi:FXSXX-COOH protein